MLLVLMELSALACVRKQKHFEKTIEELVEDLKPAAV